MCFAGNSVFACAGLGLTKEKLNEHLTGMEELVKNDSELVGLNLLSIVWSNLQIEAGAEGDCSASGVTGRASVVTKDVNDSYCTLEGPVTLSKSSVLGDYSSVELTKDAFRCQ